MSSHNIAIGYWDWFSDDGFLLALDCECFPTPDADRIVMIDDGWACLFNFDYFDCCCVFAGLRNDEVFVSVIYFIALYDLIDC